MSDHIPSEVSKEWAQKLLDTKLSDLIPRAEAEAMVAAAVKKAAGVCASLYKGERHQDAYDQGRDDGLDFAEQRIEALTPADARAALDKMLAGAKLEGFNAAADHIREMYPAEWQQLGPSVQRSLSGLKKNMANAMKGGDDE